MTIATTGLVSLGSIVGCGVAFFTWAWHSRTTG